MAAHSIFLRSFVTEIVRKTGRETADVERELLDAARAAVSEHFGDATPTSVEMSKDIGEVIVRQELVIASAPGDRAKEISLLDVRRLGVDANEGDGIALPVFYTGGHDAELTQLAGWKTVAPLPLHDEHFWDVLNAKLNAAVQAYFPPKPHRPGTLGGLLHSGGGWLRGVSGTSGATSVTVESTFLDILSLSPTHEWADYGFVVRVRGTPAGDRELRIDRGDNEGNIRSWCELPTVERSREQVERALVELAAEIERELAKPASDADDTAWKRDLRFVNGHTWTRTLLVNAVQQPGPGSLMRWMQEELPPAIDGHTCVVEVHGGTITFAVWRFFAPDVGLEGFGNAAIRVTAEVEGMPALIEKEFPGDVIQLGSVEHDALTRPGPITDEERADVAGIVTTFLAWLDEHLRWHAAHHPLEHYQESFDLFYAFPGYFPLVSLLQQRLMLGPPGPPPVPPFDDAALELAGRSLKPVLRASRDGAFRPGPAKPEHVAVTTFGMFSVKGWKIVLSDDLQRRPFSLPEIAIVPPEGGPPVVVMMVDAWNPQARTVVDGDAFAFRRFLTWLREAILRGGYDAEVEFALEDEEEDDEDEESDSETESPTLTMSISTWLLFDMPETGDRYLVDWRAQWHVVNAIGRVEDFAGIYGFTGEFLDGLRTRAIPQWRRFLREVIDPRFDATTGAKLLL